ncbi:hypothetical protein P879_08286 [Paragonimus westermani]|uniref:Uncharacterized protein n=1 Tax=Paragonimus westermani TaxID=34504 RepID=A0A8T0DPM2_9TREM|nr:hypothetical protein P879_08286 [Paragonimus westermani]
MRPAWKETLRNCLFGGKEFPTVTWKGYEVLDGVNQLLVLRNHERNGWCDANPISPNCKTGSAFLWEGAQPDGHEPVTVYERANNYFNDYSAFSPRRGFAVVCEYSGKQLASITDNKFQSKFFVRLGKLIQTNSAFTVCFAANLTHVTRIRCALA